MTNINTFQGDVFIHEYIKHSGDENNLFGFSDTDTFKIATAGTDRLTVKADGDVGIGVAAPNAILDIRASSADPGAKPTVHIGDNAADAGDYGMLQLVRAASAGTKCHMSLIRSGNTVTGIGYYNNNTNTFCVWPSFANVNETPAISVNSDGNVGIGTSDPKDDLHIFEASNGQTTGLFIEKQNGASGTAQITFGVAAGSEGATGKPKAGIFFERTGSNGLGEFHFCIDSNNDNNAVALSDVKMAIINNGNVGVGTVSPGQRLHIYNNVDNVGMSVQNNARKYTVGVRGDTSDAFAIQDDTANAIRATITSAGRLKVGTVTTSNDTAIIGGGGATSRVARNNYLNINLDFQFARGFHIVSFGYINFHDANIVNTQAINVTSGNGPYRTVLAGSLSYIQISTLSSSVLRFRGVNLPSVYNDWALNHWYGGYVF